MDAPPPYEAAIAVPVPATVPVPVPNKRRGKACGCVRFFPRFSPLSRCETALFLLAALAVLVAFVLCAVLIPWPGTRVVLLYPNQQGSLTANGLFTRSVEVVTADGDAPVTVRGYTRAPPYYRVRGEPMVLTDVLVQGMRNFSLATYVSRPNLVNMAMSNPYECWERWIYINFFKFDSVEAHQAFADSGDASGAYDSYSFVGSLSGGGTFHQGFSHFVLYNPDCPMSETPTSLTITVDSDRYTSDAALVFECTAGRCVDTIPYGENRFYVTDGPFDPTGQDTARHRTEVTLHGYAGAYVALYLGIFGSCVLVLAAAFNWVRRRRAGVSETGESEPASERKALIAVQTGGRS